MSNNWWRKREFWLLLAGGIAIAVAGSNLPLADWFTSLQDWLATLGMWAMPAFIALYLLATILGLPNVLLMLVSGSLFGLVQGILLVSLADTLGAIACFLIGRTIARKPIKRWINRHPNFAQLDQAVGQKGWKILLLTRLSPLMPSNLLNYGFSCTRVNFWQYCLFSWIGMLPIIALYVYLGSFGVRLLQEGLTPGKIALQSFGAVLAIGAALYTTRLARKALTPVCDTPIPQPEVVGQPK